MKTDKWYKNQPEWGTKESDKKARFMTPGQIDEEEYDRKRDMDAERGVRRKKVMSFSAHSKMSPEDRAKHKANAKKAMAASLANVKKQFEESEVSEISLGKVRSKMYKAAKTLGDVQAVKKNKVGKRIVRRAVGKVTGKMLGKLFK